MRRARLHIGGVVVTWTKLIDVSAYQSPRGDASDVDFAKARDEDGIRGVHVRVAVGKQLDHLALAFLARASLAGLLTGIYQYVYPTRNPEDMREQAFIAWQAQGGEVQPLPAMLDLETLKGLPGFIVLEGARVWVDEWSRFTAVKPIVYTGSYFFDALGEDSTAYRTLGECPLEVAQYPRAPTMTPEECASRGLPVGSQWFPIEGVHAPRVPKLWDPARGGRGWSFWQYGGDGYRCAGVPGWCDRSVFNGDEEALRAVSGLGPRLSQVVEDFAKGIARGALTGDLVDAAIEAYQRDRNE